MGYAANLVLKNHCEPLSITLITLIQLSTFNDQQRFGAMVRMSADVLQIVAKGSLDVKVR